MTPAQCRQARELLGWTEAQLARHADIKLDKVRYVEMGNGRPMARTITAIRVALEAAGVIFVVPDGTASGVRLRKHPT